MGLQVEVGAVGDPLELGASGHELLRDKDFAEMSPDEYRRVKRLIAAIAEQRPLRASRRRRPDPRGDRLDMRKLIRQSLRTGGRHEVVDVFYVTDEHGAKIEEQARLEAIRTTIKQDIDLFMNPQVDAPESVSSGSAS